MYRKTLLAIATLTLTANLATEKGAGQTMPEQSDQMSYSGVLSKEGYFAVFGKGPEGRLKSYGLPKLRVFNRSGSLILDSTGYTGSFPDKLAESLDSNTPVSDAIPVEEEVSLTRTTDGHSFDHSGLEGKDFVFLAYGATWCAPCVAQAKDVKTYIEKRSDLEMLFLKIEADISKLDTESQIALIGMEFPKP